MESFDKLAIFAPNKESYLVDFENANRVERSMHFNKVPSVENCQTYEDYRREWETWSAIIKHQFMKSVLPVPISFVFHIPQPPHVPTANEKIRGSHDDKIASRQFNVHTTPLYPINHLKMQEMILSGTVEAGDFPETGPRGQVIPIQEHVGDGKYFSSTLVPIKPKPQFYSTYEEYKQSMEKWMKVTAPFIENVPWPKSLGTTLKLMKTVDEQRIHAYNHSYQEVKCPIDPRLTKLTISKELYPALEAIIYELRTYIRKPMLKPSKSMEKFSDLRLDSLDSRIELNNQKHLHSLLTLSKYNPTMIDPVKYEEALRMTLNYKTSKYHRLSVLSLMEELLNRQHTDINKLFQNDIYLFYALAMLLSEFSPNNVSILAPVPKLNGSSNNIIVFNHANASFLELYYTLIIFKHFERKKDEFPNAYHLFSDRINGLSFQANEILKTFTNDLISAVKENLNKNSLDFICLTFFLIIISNAPFLEQFIVNPEFPFFTFLKNIYKIDPKKTIKFCEQLFIHKSAAVTMLPLLFEMFSQHHPEDFINDSYIIFKFISLIFAIHPKFVKEDSVEFIPFFLVKIETILSENTEPIVFEATMSICLFALHFLRLGTLNEKASNTIFTQSSKFLYQASKFANTNEKKIFVMKPIISFCHNSVNSSFISNLPEEFYSFLFKCCSDSDLNVSKLSWRITSFLVSSSKLFRNNVLKNQNLISVLSDAAYHPSDACIYYVVKMIMTTLTNDHFLCSDNLFKVLNSTQTPQYLELKKIIISPEVKMEGLIRTLLSHRPVFDVPLQYNTLAIFENFVNRRSMRPRKSYSRN